MVKGSLNLLGQELSAGDGASIVEERELLLAANQDAEFLVFDLPL